MKFSTLLSCFQLPFQAILNIAVFTYWLNVVHSPQAEFLSVVSLLGLAFLPFAGHMIELALINLVFFMLTTALRSLIWTVWQLFVLTARLLRYLTYLLVPVGRLGVNHIAAARPAIKVQIYIADGVPFLMDEDGQRYPFTIPAVNRGYNEQAVAHSSGLTNAVLPPGHVYIDTEIGLGMGFRVQEGGATWLCTALHNLERATWMRVTGPRGISVTFSIAELNKIDSLFCLETDTILFKLPPKYWADLQVSSLKLGVATFTGTHSITGHHMTTKELKTHVGRNVSYDVTRKAIVHNISTDRGCSGAPLISSNTVVGIHVRADTVENRNIAYPISQFFVTLNEAARKAVLSEEYVKTSFGADLEDKYEEQLRAEERMRYGDDKYQLIAEGYEITIRSRQAGFEGVIESQRAARMSSKGIKVSRSAVVSDLQDYSNSSIPTSSWAEDDDDSPMVYKADYKLSTPSHNFGQASKRGPQKFTNLESSAKTFRAKPPRPNENAPTTVTVVDVPVAETSLPVAPAAVEEPASLPLTREETRVLDEPLIQASYEQCFPLAQKTLGLEEALVEPTSRLLVQSLKGLATRLDSIQSNLTHINQRSATHAQLENAIKSLVSFDGPAEARPPRSAPSMSSRLAERRKTVSHEHSPPMISIVPKPPALPLIPAPAIPGKAVLPARKSKKSLRA